MSTQPVKYLAVLKASYDYTPQSDDEIQISENQILYLVERVDDDWWKVKIKGQSQEADSPVGLVPAAYVEPADHESVVVAVYDYEAAAPGELSIKEDERLLVFDKEDEWILAQSETGGGMAGWVPGNYVEPASDTSTPAIAAASIVIPPSPPRPVSTYVDPADRVASSKARSDDIKTWSVSEVDAKGKKKKGTLGVGNGSIFFASESDKTPVQKWETSAISRVSVEKNKHLHIDIGGATPINLHFSTGSRDLTSEIVEKLEISRALAAPLSSSKETQEANSSPSSTSARVLPPIRSDTPKAVRFSPASPSIIPPREEVDGEEGGDVIQDEGVNQEERVSQKESAVALYDFDADGDDELSVKEGELLLIIEKDGDEWWKCRGATGKEGVVPASYLETKGLVVEPKVDNTAARQAEERRLEQERLDREKKEMAEKERLKREKERERAEREKAEKERKRAEGEARAKEAAAVAEAERVRRKERAAKQQQRSSVSQHSSSRASLDNGKPAPDRTRIWHDRTGQFRVEAAFLGFNNGKMRLHKINGVIVEVPLEKMSPEDLRYAQKLEAKKSNSPGTPRASDDDVPLALTEAAQSQRSSINTQSKKGPAFDWFDFFLSAGCDLDDCTRYASSFERDKIDEAILPDITESVMRSLGLREGDIIRVMKAVEKRKPKAESPASDPGKAVSPPPNLFAGPGGALKNNAPRRGRPQPSKSLPAAVDLNAITTVSDQIQRSSSPQVSNTVATTAPVQPPPRASSAAPASGFDDDAWTNRPSSTKPLTPVPPAPAPARAPSAPPVNPPSAPPAAPAQPPAAPVPTPTSAAPPQPTATPLAKTTESDIFDQLARLSQLRVSATSASPPTSTPTITPTIQAPPTGYRNGLGMGSSPAPMGQHLQTAAMGGYISPPPMQQGPRGPFAPVPANQGLLQPLIPTQTGLNAFIPTRPAQSQPTGFIPQSAGFNPQPTGFNPQQNGFSSPPQQIGFNPSPLMSQPTGIFAGGLQNGGNTLNPMFGQGFNPSQPSNNMQPHFAQSNPTGFNPGFGQSFGNGAPPVPQQPSNTTSPANIFAQMKSGTFGNDNVTNPQAPEKYDALRTNPISAQPTGWYQGNYGGF